MNVNKKVFGCIVLLLYDDVKPRHDTTSIYYFTYSQPKTYIFYYYDIFYMIYTRDFVYDLSYLKLYSKILLLPQVSVNECVLAFFFNFVNILANYIYHVGFDVWS